MFTKQFYDLSKPFKRDDVHFRVMKYTKAKDKYIPAAYLNARDVMSRLDSVLGSFGWESSMSVVDNSTICELTCRIDDRWVTKTDVAGQSNVEGEKGGASDALKRAAVQFGIGRYLYYCGNTYLAVEKGGKKTIYDVYSHYKSECDEILSKAEFAFHKHHANFPTATAARQAYEDIVNTLPNIQSVSEMSIFVEDYEKLLAGYYKAGQEDVHDSLERVWNEKLIELGEL